MGAGDDSSIGIACNRTFQAGISAASDRGQQIADSEDAKTKNPGRDGLQPATEQPWQRLFVASV